eukprot:jgi/Hompol1/2773/HPOL_002309-RA
MSFNDNSGMASLFARDGAGAAGTNPRAGAPELVDGSDPRFTQAVSMLYSFGTNFLISLELSLLVCGRLNGNCKTQ